MADTDFIRFSDGPAPIKTIAMPAHLSWPPPERLRWYDVALGVLADDSPDADAENLRIRGVLDGEAFVVYVRGAFSQFTDEEAAELTHVARGAEYRVEQ